MRLSFGVSPFFGSTIGSPVVYGARRRSLVGREIFAMARSSDVELRHVEPAPLGPALQAQLGELHARGALGEIMLPRRAGDDVADEVLPLDLEAVVVGDVLRQLLPLVEELHGLRHVRIPYRARRVHAVLGPAAGEPGDRRAVRAVRLEGDEVVAPHADAPRAVD